MLKFKRLLNNAVNASVNALTAARDAAARAVQWLEENVNAEGRDERPQPRATAYGQGQQQHQEPIEEGWEALDYQDQSPPQPRPILPPPVHPSANEENRSAQSGRSRNRSNVHVDYYDNPHREEAAKQERLMKECYANAKRAKREKDHESARWYREKAKEHKRLKIAAHKKGVEFVLSQNPTNEREDTVDLHGLRVDEALEVVKDRLGIAEALNLTEYHIITGRGIHSKDHQPKIKPRIMEYLATSQYWYSEDEHNPGSLTVFLLEPDAISLSST